MKQTIVLAAVAVILVACGADEDGRIETEVRKSVPELSELQKKVMALPTGQRDAVLFRAIVDGGAPCQGVIDSVQQDGANGAPAYVARCKDGPVYLVNIAHDGIARVTGRKQGH